MVVPLGRGSGNVTGSSVHVPRQKNSWYEEMVRCYIYETRWPKHPQFANPMVWTKPPGTCSNSHYMKCCKDMDRPYSTSISTSASRVPSPPPIYQFLQALLRHIKSREISNASTVIGIRSSALDTISDSTQLSVSYLINSPFLTWIDS